MDQDLILIVADNHQIESLLEQQLISEMAIDLLSATDSKSTIWTVKTNQVSTIILDLDLPDIEGLDLLKQLETEGFRIPTIILSNGSCKRIAVEAFQLGVSDYLVKPLQAEALKNALNRALSLARIKREKSTLAFKLEEQASWMKVLTEVGKSVTSSLDLDEVLKRIVEAGVDLTGAEEGFLALLDDENGQLYLRAVKNIDEQKSKTMQLPVSDSLVGEVMRTGQPYRTTQVAEDPPLKVSTGYLVYSLLHAPLISKGKILGVMSVDNHNCRQLFTDTHEKQLTSLADYAAVAIENASLYQQAQQEIRERKEAEKKLQYDAFHDSLTGLANRALFIDRMRLSIERAHRRDDYKFAVLFLDLDRFKDINDSLGHSAGDQLLIRVARLLESILRPTDTVARLGGDEFVILLDDIINISDASWVADRIQEVLSSSGLLENRDLYTSTSIGIVMSDATYKQPEDILRDADIAMYRAKAQGKARFEVFDPVMRNRIVERLAIEADLRRALDGNELRVYYQPIVSLKSHQITGFEALIRWEHPDRGLLLPVDFISVAEDTGLVSLLDRWILKQACKQMKAWQDDQIIDVDTTISVNISAAHISQSDLTLQVEKILNATGLASRNLKIEITENAIMENNEVTTGVFKKLQDLGVQIQIDDFGVGYSSLSYLSNFPINALKIDQSFVNLMTANGNQSKIIQAIIMLAHGLGIEVIAEGVETDGQLQQLRNLGCTYAQGYLISKPQAPERIPELIEKLKIPSSLLLTIRSRLQN